MRLTHLTTILNTANATTRQPRFGVATMQDVQQLQPGAIITFTLKNGKRMQLQVVEPLTPVDKRELTSIQKTHLKPTLPDNRVDYWLVARDMDLHEVCAPKRYLLKALEDGTYMICLQEWGNRRKMDTNWYEIEIITHPTE